MFALAVSTALLPGHPAGLLPSMCMCVHAHVCLCACVCMHMCVCVYVCVCRYWLSVGAQPTTPVAKLLGLVRAVNSKLVPCFCFHKHVLCSSMPWTVRSVCHTMFRQCAHAATLPTLHYTTPLPTTHLVQNPSPPPPQAGTLPKPPRLYLDSERRRKVLEGGQVLSEQGVDSDESRPSDSAAVEQQGHLQTAENETPV